MDYLLTSLEGVMTFVSPCLLPMLPIYLSYFARSEGSGQGRTLANALGFVLGFSVVFMLLGAFAGTLGGLLIKYQTAVNLVTGAIVVLMGLSILGILNLKLPAFGQSKKMDVSRLNFGTSVLFGIVFSINWTPCVGAFLGAALSQAARTGSVFTSALMLLCYSLGLGIPFVLSALLLGRLGGAFDWMRRHMLIINRVSGILLIAFGLLMMTGYLGRFLALFA